MFRRCALLILTIAAAASSVEAARSKEYDDWGLSPARLLMTRAEQEAWNSVRTDEDAKHFIELFWARRDPTPDTPANEFRTEFEERIRVADKRFATQNAIGSQTDRGEALVLFGEPDHVDHFIKTNESPVAGSSDALSRSTAQFNRPLNEEVWTYRNDKALRMGTRQREVQLAFQDTHDQGRLEIAAGSKRLLDVAAVAVAQAAFKRPDLLAAAPTTNPAQPAFVALRMILVGDEATAYDLLRRLQDGADFAELARRNSKHASAEFGGYIGRIAAAELAPDFRKALAEAKAGAPVVIKRAPTEFAVVKVLTEAEAKLADKELPAK
jgi:GWxTD domain-containing protein